MTQPDALKKNEPLTWSTGIGTDVWDLFCACIRGNLETVQRLVDWAVMTRQPDVIDELLRRGSNINARRSDGARPIPFLRMTNSK